MPGSLIHLALLAPRRGAGPSVSCHPVRFFFQAIGGVSTKRRAMSFGYVVDMDKISKRFLAERDPTTGSGITGLQSSEFPSLKRLFSRCRVGSAQQN